MNKQQKKTLESDLTGLIQKTLNPHNAVATRKIEKHIRSGVKNIVKKFSKHIPDPASSEKTKKTTVEAAKKITPGKKPTEKNIKKNSNGKSGGKKS